ncbi:MAG TPA: NAD(P)/FAD-dependent oxidoreductase [Chloroflexia bacterium]|jgi:thioredoxin reductase (NADPH)
MRVEIEETTQPQKGVDDNIYMDREFDCAVLGGGPAGLSAAIYMGRMRRSVIVLDDEEGRSTWHQVNRNYLGFPDGVHATALREVGAMQASKYGVEFLQARATDVQMDGDGRDRRFCIATRAGNVVARTLILATGVSDRFPEFEGSMECIGKSMFWCIICDGYEAIDKRIVVLGHNERAACLALELLVFTPHVTLVSWDEPLDLSEQKLRTLKEHGIEVHECGCEVYHCSKGQISAITLEDGTELELDMLFVVQWIEPNTQLAKQLNITLDEHGYILTDAEQNTNIEGVYAAGDVTKLHNHQVASAVHEGGMAAAAANYYLYEDWQKE